MQEIIIYTGMSAIPSSQRVLQLLMKNRQKRMGYVINVTVLPCAEMSWREGKTDRRRGNAWGNRMHLSPCLVSF